MSKEKKCPNCGEMVDLDERFCPECGSEVPAEVQPVMEQGDKPLIGAGARTNVTGGISQTTNTQNHVNTSNVDNSSTVTNTSTVNHNTTYVVNEKKKEFCEVCGNPLEEKHARCPKCGKEICLDCKVKGKTRCIECEKKVMNEYRLAFQQLLLTTNGSIGVAGRQMMNQKARELDLEDVKTQIEKELMEMFKPTPKPVQPEVAPMASTATANNARVAEEAKGVGSLDGRKPIKSKGGNGGNSMVWIIIVLVLVAVIAVFVLLGGGESKEENTTAPAPASTEQVQSAEPQKRTTPAEPASSAPAAQKETKVVPEQQSAPVVQPVANQTDANYEAGMKAYKAGNGLDAINAFKKSGSAKAYYMLGVIYENGCGNVGKNAMMARKNFKKAAQMGSEEAKAKL